MPGPAWRDWLRAIGAPEDPVATDTTSSWSLISLWKAILQSSLDHTLIGPAGTSYLYGASRRVIAAGTVTISATTDDRVYVNKTSPAATNVVFPSVAARVAAGSSPIFLKNEHANPALYPLTPVLNGTDTMEGTDTPLPQDSRTGVWYWPDDQVTPNNWETR